MNMGVRTSIEKVLIANRGEIAVRIAQTLRRLGIDSVAVFSDADQGAMHVQACDEAIHIGASEVSESYLNMDVLIDAARRSGAHAIHPGYGFLSESADFAQAVNDAGLIWIGPSALAIRMMGDKAQAKKRMAAAGVPLAKGFQGSQEPEKLRSAAQDIGFPVLIKATAGGGGRGIRIVSSLDEFDGALLRAKSEALNAFGDETVLLERFIEYARHIEVQVFGDEHGSVVHLFERDCSLQRRRQKIIEEAPAFGLPEATRAELCAAAVLAASSIGYVGAGTVEFLYEESTDSFFFLEMNTRLQVEHPVTEAITGQDLVEWQITVAEGGALPCTQEEISKTGHAIEARLYAEDPERGFLPVSGHVAHWDPSRTRMRIDTGVFSGSEISSYYDPMIAKVIVHAPTRAMALRAIRHTLRNTPLLGFMNNRAFLHELLGEKAVQQNKIDTGYVERTKHNLPQSTFITICAASLLMNTKSDRGWGTRGVLRWPLVLEINGEEVAWSVERVGSKCIVLYEKIAYSVLEVSRTDSTLSINVDGHVKRIHYCWSESTLFIDEDLAVSKLKIIDPYERSAESESTGRLVAPMMGRVVSVSSSIGKNVQVGDTIVVIEAMKMEHPVRAQIDGVLESFHVTVGDQVSAEQILGVVAPLENHNE